MNNPANTLLNAVANPMTELVLRTTFGTRIFSFASNVSTSTVKPVPKYAGTTCHRVPSNLAWTKTTAAGNRRLPRICVFFRSPSAAGKEEDLNALFAETVDASHNKGSNGLLSGFRKKWNSFTVNLNALSSTIVLSPSLSLLLSDSSLKSAPIIQKLIFRRK